MELTEKANKKRLPIREGLLTTPLSPLSEVQLLGGRCKDCQEISLGKGQYCPNCGAEEKQDLPLSKRGKLWTYTIIRHRPPGDYKGPDPFSPYGLGLVELPEGIRVLSPLDAETSDLAIGMPLELAVFKLYEDTEGNEIIAFKFKSI